MIEWGAFLIVAIVSLAAASGVVTIASFGMKLYQKAQQQRATQESSGRIAITVARILFGVCALIVVFGVYLIVPGFH